eukprot:CAMPEP_0116971030 /NCGR_PEP_ID=MMETSP0467-20121206/52923_1 /TAXON_ID=283647 /ORGANISM="Mesodinium pulex, Strain SPMC105" /LENGTH=44 /DNA_ID= /DNA_START= /DNA_END= /DNA_ORIENTATION=
MKQNTQFDDLKMLSVGLKNTNNELEDRILNMSEEFVNSNNIDLV